MPRGSTYVGRHRGRHRAIPEQRTRGLTLPGAAAAALTITATGAAVVPGLGSGTASATDGHSNAPQATRHQAAGASAVITPHAPDAELSSLAQRSRVRASRARVREEIVEKREAALAKARRWVSPVERYRVTSGYGTRWGRLHAGDDFAAPIGSRIGSISSGTVIFAGRQSGYGLKVEVRHWDGTVSWYGHMSSISVQVGDEVDPGDKLGEVGNTGHSTGPHLHLEIHPDGGGSVDPQRWLADQGLRV